MPLSLICCTSEGDKIRMHRTQLMNSLQTERVSELLYMTMDGLEGEENMIYIYVALDIVEKT
jgi:hypothetical protein